MVSPSSSCVTTVMLARAEVCCVRPRRGIMMRRGRGTYKRVFGILNFENSLLRRSLGLRSRRVGLHVVARALVLLETAALCSRTLAGHLRAFMLYRGGRIAGRRGRAAAFLRTGAGTCGIRAAGTKR